MSLNAAASDDDAKLPPLPHGDDLGQPFNPSVRVPKGLKDLKTDHRVPYSGHWPNWLNAAVDYGHGRGWTEYFMVYQARPLSVAASVF